MNSQNRNEIAVSLAIEAGQKALGLFQKSGLEVNLKSDGSLFSEADKAAEDIIVRGLTERWPDQPIIGEETIDEKSSDYFANALNAEHVWVIDPIDGTNNFLAGDPTWCVSIAHLKRGTPTLGVIYFPALNDELYYNKIERVIVRREVSKTSQEAEVFEQPAPQHDCPLFMAHDSFYTRFRLNYPHVPRVSGCSVIDILNVVRGRAIGAITSAHLWDFAAPLAFAFKKNIQMIEIFSGRELTHFVPDDLYLTPENPKKAWKLKEEYMIAPSSRINELIKGIERLAK